MELITPELPSNATRVFGTAMGMSGEDSLVVEEDIRQMIKYNGIRHPFQMGINNALSCTSLFTHYWRTLSRS
jgi:hypothetical protein